MGEVRNSKPTTTMVTMMMTCCCACVSVVGDYSTTSSNGDESDGKYGVTAPDNLFPELRVQVFILFV